MRAPLIPLLAAMLAAALDDDPGNPYALLNLGVIYQKQGRLQDARGMYRRVIDSRSSAVAGQATAEEEVGRRLTTIAEANLAQMP